MKKLIIPIISLLSCAAVMAQGEFDALRYSQTDINGTARFISMGGAFGALGGDGSSIALNPAGLGVYRSSEISISTGLSVNTSSSDFLKQSSSDNKYSVPFNNFTYVINLGESGKKKGLVNSNFAFSFNKLKNFNRNMYIAGKGNTTSLTDYMSDYSNGINYSDIENDGFNLDYQNRPIIPYLTTLAYNSWMIDTIPGETDQYQSILDLGEPVDQSYTLTEKGYVNEWNFAYAANISNKIYIGASLGVQSLEYSSSKQYQEDFSKGGGFLLTSDFLTKGSGTNFKIGTIIRPLNILRIGASIATPTFFKLTDTYQTTISSSESSNNTASPIIDSYYKLQGPMQYDLSMALVMGKVGIFSADYGFANYSSMKLRDDTGISSNFQAENNGMSNYLKNTQTLRLGLEVKLDKELALRAGYATTSNATDDKAVKKLALNTTRTDTEYFLDKGTQYISGGLGYRPSNWFFDFAYQLRINDLEFHPYAVAGVSEVASISSKTSNYILSVGYKF